MTTPRFSPALQALIEEQARVLSRHTALLNVSTYLRSAELGLSDPRKKLEAARQNARCFGVENDPLVKAALDSLEAALSAASKEQR